MHVNKFKKIFFDILLLMFNFSTLFTAKDVNFMHFLYFSLKTYRNYRKGNNGNTGF